MFVLLFALIIVLLVVVSIAQKKRIDKLETETRRRVQLKYRYKIDEFHVSFLDRSLVGISLDAHKIILGAIDYDAEYRFDQIASVEVVENGATVTKTNRGSQVLGAAVGGLAFGVVGAAVGGLSGSSRSQGRLQGISLKVTVEDRLRPVHMICFLRADKEGLDPNDPSVRQIREHVDRFHAHMLNAMRQAQQTHPVASAVRPVASTADELQKLWDMKQAGILTEDEFAQLKGRLLGR